MQLDEQCVEIRPEPWNGGTGEQSHDENENIELK